MPNKLAAGKSLHSTQQTAVELSSFVVARTDWGDWHCSLLCTMATRRALHFVFKVGDRTTTSKFYREVLGMKVRTSTQAVTFVRRLWNGLCGVTSGDFLTGEVLMFTLGSHRVLVLLYHHGKAVCLGLHKVNNTKLWPVSLNCQVPHEILMSRNSSIDTGFVF